MHLGQKRFVARALGVALLFPAFIVIQPVVAQAATLWSSTSIPATVDVADNNSVELGVKFRTSVVGQVTGLRFYKSAANTGTHTGSLWSATGTKLAQMTFTGETTSGWQEAAFATPVTVATNTTYVVSYHAPAGHYSATSPFFAASAVVNGPLTALKDGTDGGNGVYAYGSSVAFPSSTYKSTNYWVDPVFTAGSAPVDTTRPTVTGVSPGAGATGVATSAPVVVSFSEALAATSAVSAVSVKNAAGQSVAGSSAYDTAAHTITFTPSAAWATGTTYTATVATSVTDAAGNALAAPYTWSFTTANATGATDLTQGPGGSILVLYNTSNPFSEYTAEILRAEGLDSFASAAVSTLSAGLLSQYDVAVLGDVAVTSQQVTLLTDWVTAGGNLIAMHPDKKLAGLLGLVDDSATQANAYLRIDTSAAPGAGITAATMQYHGPADLYEAAAGTRTVAALYTASQTATTHPAVTLRNVGTNSGQAVAFTYDLARSVVFTHQGNPAWAGQDRDGIAPIRSDDLFFGAAAGDVQPDWVDLTKVAIPQADEQQRLLSNTIEYIDQDNSPLPKFWYFPKGAKAVLVMAGDDHATANGTQSTFDELSAMSPANCSVADWTCLRATSYMYAYGPMTAAQAAAYEAQGFDVGSHVSTGCVDWTPAALTQAFQNDLGAFRSTYPSLPAQGGSRTHCIVWSDWASEPKIEASFGIRMDLNYYYWPGTWVQNRPGYMTGSGIPMRFADSDGTMIDVYQEPSELVNENGETYPAGIAAMLEAALGPDGYYGAIGTHYDYSDSFASELAQAALAYGIPAVSVQQMLDWTDARNASSFTTPVWNGGTLTFGATVGTGAGSMMRGMLPVTSAKGTLSALAKGGTPVSFTVETIKGIAYALFPATTGTYTANYGADTTPPTVTGVSPSVGATGVSVGTPVVVTFSEALTTASTAGSVVVKNASGQTTAGTTSYGTTAHTITFTPSTSWATGTTYTATVATSVTDAAGNALTSPYTWSFTTASGTATTESLWAPTAQSVSTATTDTTKVQLGVQVRAAVAGTITAITFYKSYNDASSHTVTLWNNSGVSLATATTSNETTSGWQTATFSTPVAVTAGTTYTASYLATTGRYSYTTNALGSGFTHGDLSVPANGGVYAYGGGFPTQTWGGSNYWIDILFTPGSTPADTTPPTVTGVSPGVGATGVPTSAPVVVSFSEALAAAATVGAVAVKSASGQAVAGSSSYGTAAHTVTFTPSAVWATATTYTATVATSVTDAAGNALAAAYTWSFTTASGSMTTESLWAPTVPSVSTATSDTAKVEIGIQFRAAVAGTVSGVKFYKSYNDASSHVLTLWSSAGVALATATTSGETASGWQTATFSTPVAVTAGVTYTASYLAASGRYSYTTSALGSGYTNGDLSVPANGGVYLYAGGFPTQFWSASNYWVDILFTKS